LCRPEPALFDVDVGVPYSPIVPSDQVDVAVDLADRVHDVERPDDVVGLV
jgi:hypothetical protein